MAKPWSGSDPDGKRLRGRRLQERRAGWFRAHPLCGDRLDGSSPEHSVCVREHRNTLATVLDHIVPLAKQGADEPGNWQSLCRNCAAMKDAADRGVKLRPRIGVDGLPIDPCHDRDDGKDGG